MTDQPKAPINRPISRPASARPRGSAGDAAGGAANAEAEGEARPPGLDELAAIELGFAELTRYSGAEVLAGQLSAVLVRLPGRGVGYNFVACPRWARAEVGRRLAQVADMMRRAGEWPALVVAAGVSVPAELEELLPRAGWDRLEGEQIMWTRASPPVPHLDPALRIEAVTGRTAAEYEALEREIFGLPPNFAEQRTQHLARAVDAGELRAYLLRLHGEAVATTRLTTTGTVRCLFGVGVAAAHRRRGLGTLVTAVATRAALAGGASLAWLSVDEGNSAAFGVYRRLGYQPAYRWSRWVGPDV